MSDRTFVLRPFVNLEGDSGDSEGVLVDTHSATMCACNVTAWVLLRALKSKASVAELVDTLVTRFDVAEPEARKDVMNFIHQLATMEFVDETS